MIYDGKDLRIAVKVVVPRGFSEWEKQEKIDYILENLSNPIIVLSVNEITERRKDGKLK